MRQELEAVRGAYREVDWELALLYYELCSRELFEDKILVPSRQNRERLKKEFERLSSLVKELAVPAPQFAAVKGHFEDFLQETAWQLKTLFEDPAEALRPFLWKYESMEQDHRSEEEQEALLLRIYEQLPEVWSGIRSWIKEAEPEKLRRLCDTLSGAAEGIRRTSFSSEALRKAMEQAADRFVKYAKETEELLDCFGEPSKNLPDTERTIRMPEEEYRALLRDHRGVDLDELLSWGTSEMEKTRSRCFSLAKDLARDKGEPIPETMAQVNELLNKYAGPCDSPEEMFARAGSYIKRTRALAHEYVKLPETERCDIVETPWKLRYSFPWGGYSDGDTKERPIHGRMFLNQYNYQNVTDGWLKMNCLHEAYPGHHVQFVRTITDPIPETMKIGAKSIPLMEGMCHRTEHAFEFIYGEDPFYPLFVAYRQHHTAVRIQVDLMLRYFGKTIEEGTRVYMEELGFDHRTARGQVQAQEDMPGYFTCYYYGMKKICDWEQEYGFEKKEYTELLFSLSNVSLNTFEKVLKLTKAERESFFQDFRSLHMDPEETF